MPPVISKGEKALMYALFVCIDGVQIILTFLVVTIWLIPLLDYIAAGVLAFYALKRGLFTPVKALTLFACFFAEQIPLIDDFPFWTLDLRNLYSGSITPEEAAVASVPPIGTPNQAGTRLPSKPEPLNKGGTRPPRKV